MTMAARTYQAGGSKYRYGMNGQELEDELFEGANSAEYWMYDSRLGRRFENNPLAYDWQSPYATFDNNPIFFADPNGIEPEGNGGGNGSSAKQKRPPKTK